jgi:tRNA pseudouridine32 synthase/23S rRNA pseudouridine746 synthase
MPSADKPYPQIIDFLVQRFPSVGESVWKQRVVEGKVLDASGAPVTDKTPYLPQQKLFYFREVLQEPIIPLQEQIVFQNDELLIACKPPFLPVTPAGPYVNECLLNRLRAKTGNSDLVPLHRIDRETSGLVLFSMNSATRGLYGGLFLNGRIKKRYAAVAEMNHPPKEEREWTVENRLVKGEPWFRMRSVAGISNARSIIRLVAFEEGRGYFLLNPLTGKQHQLRLHMSALGFPIVNDRYYPALLPKQADDFDNPLQLLAQSVQFKDPVSGKKMEFESERKLLF